MCGSTNSVGSIFVYLFGMSKIYQCNSSILIYDEIRGLDVAINETMTVHLPQNESNLAHYNQSEFGIEILHHF